MMHGRKNIKLAVMFHVFLLSAVERLIFQPTLPQDNGYRYQLHSSTGAGGETKNRNAYAGSGTLAVHFEDLLTFKFADSSAIVLQLSVTITTAVIHCWRRDKIKLRHVRAVILVMDGDHVKTHYKDTM